jgi:thioredoxin 1
MTTAFAPLTAATFDEAIQSSDTPVVVDVWAEWCQPCKMLEPVLASIAEDHAGRIQVLSVDADEHPDITRRYGVMAMPTLLVFDHGELVHRVVGAKGKGALLEELAGIL